MKITPILTPDGTTAHFRATSHAVRKLQAACRSDIDVGACAVEEESWAVCGRETIDTTASTLAACGRHGQWRAASAVLEVKERHRAYCLRVLRSACCAEHVCPRLRMQG